jgi:uncharacterized protein (DUF305 family)
MENKFFMHQIKRTNGEFSKGIVINDTYDAAKQGYHAYLGAYAYGHEANTDFVQCMITDMTGAILMQETWVAPAPEPV